MTKNIFKISTLIIALFVVACSGGNKPKDAASNFLSAVDKMDFEGAKKYATEDTGKLLDMMAGFAQMAPEKKDKPETKFEITNEVIDGDNATVTYKEEGKDEEQTIKLAKVDGKWLVAISKDDMNAKDGGEGEEGGSVMDDSMMDDEMSTTDSVSVN